MPAVRNQLLLVSGLKILQFLFGPKAQVAPHPSGPSNGNVKPRGTRTEYAHSLVLTDE
jgi:hypothetical protein